MVDNLLHIQSLNAGYGSVQVLYDMNLDCSTGEAVAVVGPNGSGKTTLMNAVFHLADIFSGEIIFDGNSLAEVSSHRIVATGLGYLRQEGKVFASMSVEENLKMGAMRLKKYQVNQRIEEVLSLLPGARRFLPRKAGTLSGGERQLFALTVTLMCSPKLVLLDEPTSGLAPLAAKAILESIDTLRNEGLSLIIVEQNLTDVLQFSNTVYLIVSGQNEFTGSPNDLLERPDLTQLYLGASGKTV